MNRVLIPVIIGIVAVGGLAVFTLANDEQDIIQDTMPNIPFSTYKYNTICDLGPTPKEIMEKPIPIAFGIIAGDYNDNKHVIEFFKTNELLSELNITPEQAFGTSKTQGIGTNYDPIFTDVMFWMPVALRIMEVHPDIIEIFEVKEGETTGNYENRIISNMNKC